MSKVQEVNGSRKGVIRYLSLCCVLVCVCLEAFDTLRKQNNDIQWGLTFAVTQAVSLR